jgi:hypothetical protein
MAKSPKAKIYEFDLNDGGYYTPDKKTGELVHHGGGDENDSGKCGCCNWEVSKGYLIATSRQKAEAELKAIRAEGGNALCGDCLAEMVIECGGLAECIGLKSH